MGRHWEVLWREVMVGDCVLEAELQHSEPQTLPLGAEVVVAREAGKFIQPSN